MNFGMRGHDIVADNIDDLIKGCNALGVKSLQLALKMSVAGFKPGMFSPSYAKQMWRAFEKNDIDISILSCYINPSNTNTEVLKKDMDFFVEILKYAKFMNAGMVALETGYVGEKCDPEKNHTEEAYQYLLSNMRKLCDAAEKLGVMIGIEGVHLFVINSAQRMRRLLDDLNSPNICVVLDPCNLINMQNYENRDEIVREAFELLGNEIAVIHLKDFVIEDGAMKGVLPGKGIMNTKELLTLATETKPNIPIMLEGVKEKDFAEVKATLEALF